MSLRPPEPRRSADSVCYGHARACARARACSLLLVLLAALAVVGGCRRTAPPPEPAFEPPRYTLGVALMNRRQEFYHVLEAAIQREAARQRVALSIQDADQDSQAQLAQVEALLATPVDALIVTPVDSQGVVPAVQAANAAGVPVITAVTAAAGGEVQCHLGVDDTPGKAAAADTAPVAEQIGAAAVAMAVKVLQGEPVPERVSFPEDARAGQPPR